MNIFNSLGSNYSLRSATRMLFSSGSGSAQQELAAYLERRYGGPSTSLGTSKVVLVYKGREALELALRTLPKGHIAMNGYTCLALYEAIVGSGHMPLYLDIPKDGLNFSAQTLAKHGNVRAVVIQNTLGTPCDIAGVAALCRERGIVLIEDLAHSIGTTYAEGREAGTIGDFVVLSFSQDKVVDAVSGGALIVRDAAYADKIRTPTKKIALTQQLKDRSYPIITWKIRAAYTLGIGKVYHALVRSLHLLSTPLGEMRTDARSLPGWYCANILRQFEALPATEAHRRTIARIYAEHLDTSLQFGFDIEHSSNLRFPILVKDRSALIGHLRQHGVHVSDIWYDAPLAPKKYTARTDYAKGTCPNAERASELMLNLPTHINVTAEDARIIATLVNDFVRTNAAYEVRDMTDEHEWEAFMAAQQPHSFLQSWLWGQQYQAAGLPAQAGSKIFRLGVYRGQTSVAAALLIEVRARRGSFLLCPHGPIVATSVDERQMLGLLTARVAQIAKEERCDFLRFCPLDMSTPEHRAMYSSLGFRDAPIHMHPELAWMLDITKSEEELLREMRKTTRYLIKKVEKEGVEITMSVDPNDIETFWPVYEATVERQHFTPFKKSHLRTEFELFAKNDQAAFFFGTLNREVVAAAIIIFYNGQAFYHHSGSKSAGSNVSYLLQWRVIQEAKRRGCTLYNFWGISPANKPKHPWAGLSLFKKGFGGSAEEYVHAQDKPLTAKYWLNYVVETARRIKRRL